MRPIVRDPLGFITACACHYGKVVRIPFLCRCVYLLTDPDDIEPVHAGYSAIRTVLLGPWTDDNLQPAIPGHCGT